MTDYGNIRSHAARRSRVTIAQAQKFPAPVTLIVPWPQGGSTDIAMRALATVTENHLGQLIVIENRGGATGTLRRRMAAASAKPDAVAQIPINGVSPAVHAEDELRRG